MKIYITTRKPIFDDRAGKMNPGDTVEMPDHKAMFYISRGEAVHYETKVRQERPSMGAGETLPSSASPVAHLSPKTTASESGYGVRKRKRPIEPSSQ